ncbi:MAG TPA: hypothetical protein VIO84_09590 [Candidatus Dormibacteraeota bacterium]|jgi:hypothetical protein
MVKGAELLDGESPEWTAVDARHWIGVYTELVAFCRDALDATEAGDGLEMRRRLRQFEARLAFWERGLESLGITKA